MPPSYSGLKEQLLSFRRIDPVTSCWIFTGALTNAGYGEFVYKYKHYYAHRVSAHLYLGLDLDDSKQQADHKDDLCKRQDCFNPEHLYVGNHGTNLVDRHKKYTPYNAKKTHCRNGHEYSPENTRYNARGDRACVICTREAQRRHRALLSSDDSDHTQLTN